MMHAVHGPLPVGRTLQRRGAAIDRSADAHVPGGSIQAGDGVVQAFARIGWDWGGNWSTSKDYLHFSASGGWPSTSSTPRATRWSAADASCLPPRSEYRGPPTSVSKAPREAQLVRPASCFFRLRSTAFGVDGDEACRFRAESALG